MKNWLVLFQKYQWLINQLYSHPSGLTLREIQYLYSKSTWSDDEELPRSTFKIWKNEINMNFDLKIYCDSGNRYHIKRGSGLGNKIEQWMINSMVLGNKLAQASDMHDRIMIEPVPSDYFLSNVLDAMKKNQIVVIRYRKYGEDKADSITLAPYCVKTYHNRWYLLGKRRDGELRIYCMDQVESIEATMEQFELDLKFSAEEFFREYFGVMIQEEERKEMTHIVLRAYKKQRFKIKNQPIHHSQEEGASGICMFDGEEWPYTDFSFDLRPTYDFVSYLESLGRYVEVIEPLSLRKELVRVHSDAIERNRLNSD